MVSPALRIETPVIWKNRHFCVGLLERCSLSGPENTKRFKIYVHLNLRLLQIFTYVQNYHLKLNVLLL